MAAPEDDLFDAVLELSTDHAEDIKQSKRNTPSLHQYSCTPIDLMTTGSGPAGTKVRGGSSTSFILMSRASLFQSLARPISRRIFIGC